MDHQLPTTASSHQWWRWPLLPFAAIGGAAIGAVLLGLVQWLGFKFQGGFTEDGWMFRYILPIFTSAAFGWLFAWIACAVAPHGKVVAGTVMTTLLFIVLLLSIAFSWLASNYSVGQAVQTTVGSTSCLIAAVVALVQAHEEQAKGRVA